MRLIDAYALINDVDGDLTDGIAEGRAIEKIMNAPVIEAVEVVRCKDCIHGEKAIGVAEGVIECKRLKMVTRADWFCAEGVRNGTAAKEAEEALSEVQTFVEGKRKDEAIIQN